jgi:hypothetical protein
LVLWLVLSPPAVTSLSEFIYSCMNNFSVWNCNIPKFMLESFYSYISHGYCTWTLVSVCNSHMSLWQKK